MTAYSSRPRAVCVDLVRTLLTEHHVLPGAVRIERAAEGLGMPANDVLYVGDADSTDIEAPSSFGMRTCAGDEAVPQLQLLDAGRRLALLSDSYGDASSLAHTILLPIDLNISDMGDMERFRQRSHFVCDTVLLIEGLVATSGFALKAIQKNLAGHVIVLIGIADFDDAPDVKKIAVERLRRLRDGGAEKVILVHTDDPANVDHYNITAIAESLGYAIELQTWKTIMPAQELPQTC